MKTLAVFLVADVAALVGALIYFSRPLPTKTLRQYAEENARWREDLRAQSDLANQ